MAKPKRLNDTALAAYGLELQRIRRAIKALEAEAIEVRDSIAAELIARKLKSIVLHGIRITLSTSKKVVSYDLAKRALSRAVLGSVTKTVVVKKAWDEQVKAGRITDITNQECLVEEEITPTIYVNDVKTAA